MYYAILGPVEAIADGAVVRIDRPQRRAVLAYLLLNANRPVPADRLADALWGPATPASARAQVHQAVSEIRRRLRVVGAEHRLATQSAGYCLAVDGTELDVSVFGERVARARAAFGAGDPDSAHGLVREALDLWRGQPLADVRAAYVDAARIRLEEQRLGAFEQLGDAGLALGLHDELVDELAPLVAANPLRERLVGHLVLALHRAGRQAEALIVARDFRARLADEQGLDPSRVFTELERAVLRADPVLDVASTISARLPTPAQLPRSAATFVGRDAQLAELDALLAEPGPVGGSDTQVGVIVGNAGAGKTTLAVRWAHRVSERFPDGQLHVDLQGYSATAPLRPVDALAQCLRALGVPPRQLPVDESEAAGLYRSLLANRRMLVLLDNAREPGQVRPLLPGSGRSLVLVTSRDQFDGLVARDGASRIRLGVLPEDDAVALLDGCVGGGRVARERAASVELARLCSGLPLALRVAAARLETHPHRTISSYVEELRAGDRMAALSLAGDRTATVPAAFDLSYAALRPDAARVFRLLGLVPGPDVTVAAVAALAGIDAAAAGQLLADLTRIHLVEERDDGRFVLHDLLRDYAVRLAARHERESAEALARLFEFYLASSDAAARMLYPHRLRLPTASLPRPAPPGFADQSAALAWLDAERRNLIAIAGHASRHGPGRITWELCDVLRGYFWLRNNSLDLLAVSEGALAAGAAAEQLHAQAIAQSGFGEAYFMLNDRTNSLARLRAALDLTRAAGWRAGEATALSNLGGVCGVYGRPREAAAFLSDAVDLDRELGLTRMLGQPTFNLASVCRDLGRLTGAAEHLAQAGDIARDGGSVGSVARVLNLSALVEHDLGRSAAALRRGVEALRLYRELGDRRGETSALCALAVVCRDFGRDAMALRLAEVACARGGDFHPEQIEALRLLGGLHLRLGRAEEALAILRRALLLATDTGSEVGAVAVRIGLAAVLSGVGDQDTALRCARRMLRFCRRHGFGLLAAEALLTLADICLARAEFPAARGFAEEAADRYAAMAHPRGQALAATLASRISAAEGAPDAAGHAADAERHRAAVIAPDRADWAALPIG
ncbi:tetratricopeptide repeat protein [Solihabitans fulvus]|uniref:Tetratricopeptide repeat protein n=1 Tax=Solihabitans fulvus TaxID=1892852 RepID=A0A5B2XES1_9PSEU|nr:AfsR/SARP family transcriptional regulator [Solihabitans fulvus]KAA2261604.1 tetratricopeptide repeat protein [Solihabitans fulvus]